MRGFRLLHRAGALVPLASIRDGFAVRATFAGVGHPDHASSRLVARRATGVAGLHEVLFGCAESDEQGRRAGLQVVRKLLSGPANVNATGFHKADKYEGSQEDLTAEVAMTRVTAGLALLVVAAYAPDGPAQEDDFAGPAPLDRPVPSDWSFAFGAGALALPSYAGASSTKILPLPWIDLRYKDRVFLSPIAGLGVNLVALPEARLGIALLPDLGPSPSAACS
jgi:hypothetical protein